jgi:hypothetical protein
VTTPGPRLRFATGKTRIIRDSNSRVLHHDIPVVAMTANAFPEDHNRL